LSLSKEKGLKCKKTISDWLGSKINLVVLAFDSAFTFAFYDF